MTVLKVMWRVRRFANCFPRNIITESSYTSFKSWRNWHLYQMERCLHKLKMHSIFHIHMTLMCRIVLGLDMDIFISLMLDILGSVSHHR